MKHYSIGLIKCKCSTAMKRGKYIKVYNFCQRFLCPNSNCDKELVAVKMVSIKRHVSAKISRWAVGSKWFKIDRDGE